MFLAVPRKSCTYVLYTCMGPWIQYDMMIHAYVCTNIHTYVSCYDGIRDTLYQYKVCPYIPPFLSLHYLTHLDDTFDYELQAKTRGSRTCDEAV
jgi:hypothetical protein